jgi:hypothetical protein
MRSAVAGRLIAGRYRLGSVIGRGGMGVVWRARDELLNRDVAVRELIWPADFTQWTAYYRYFQVFAAAFRPAA